MGSRHYTVKELTTLRRILIKLRCEDIDDFDASFNVAPQTFQPIIRLKTLASGRRMRFLQRCCRCKILHIDKHTGRLHSQCGSVSPVPTHSAHVADFRVYGSIAE